MVASVMFLAVSAGAVFVLIRVLDGWWWKTRWASHRRLREYRAGGAVRIPLVLERSTERDVRGRTVQVTWRRRVEVVAQKGKVATPSDWEEEWGPFAVVVARVLGMDGCSTSATVDAAVTHASDLEILRDASGPAARDS